MKKAVILLVLVACTQYVEVPEQTVSAPIIPVTPLVQEPTRLAFCEDSDDGMNEFLKRRQLQQDFELQTRTIFQQPKHQS